MTRGALLEFPSGVCVQQPGQVVAPLSRPHGITGTPLALEGGPTLSAIQEAVTRLIAGGMDPAAAATLMAQAVIEGAAKKRSAGAERAARYRDRKAAQGVTNRDDVTPEIIDGKRDETVTNRDNVTRTNIYTKDKISTPRSASRKRTSLPSDFSLSGPMRSFAASKGFDPPRTSREYERFCDHHRAKGSMFVDWLAAWRTWINNSIEFARQGKGGGSQWLDGIPGVI